MALSIYREERIESLAHMSVESAKSPNEHKRHNLCIPKGKVSYGVVIFGLRLGEDGADMSPYGGSAPQTRRLHPRKLMVFIAILN